MLRPFTLHAVPLHCACCAAQNPYTSCSVNLASSYVRDQCASGLLSSGYWSSLSFFSVPLGGSFIPVTLAGLEVRFQGLRAPSPWQGI